MTRKIKFVMNPITVDSDRDNTAGVWLVQYPNGELKVVCVLYSKGKEMCTKEIIREMEDMLREYSSIDDHYIIGERTRIILNNHGVFMDTWCVNRTTRVDPEITEFVDKYPLPHDLKIEVSIIDNVLDMRHEGSEYPHIRRLVEFVTQKIKRFNKGDDILIAKERVMQILTDIGVNLGDTGQKENVSSQ